MPVEALSELVAYQELVLGVAKATFKRDHPERQRVPRGFADEFQLRIEHIEDGSAMPVLERIAPSDGRLDLGDVFTNARDVIEDAVAAMAGDLDLPEAFPTEALVLFNRFGQSLGEGEGIELRKDDSAQGPTYTSEIRKRLVLNRRRTYQDEVRDIAWVSEIDAVRMSCLIRVGAESNQPVPAPLDEVTFAPVKDVLAPNVEGPPVLISGIGVFDTDRGLIRFDSLHDVSLIDDPEGLDILDDRLDELSRLSDGWLDGFGSPPAAEVLQRARSQLAVLLTIDVPRPRVFATPEGGVQAEWTVGEREISINFEPDGSLYAISVNVTDGETVEMGPDNAVQIARLLRPAS